MDTIAIAVFVLSVPTIIMASIIRPYVGLVIAFWAVVLWGADILYYVVFPVADP
jgi:hypothetical protein